MSLGYFGIRPERETVWSMLRYSWIYIVAFTLAVLRIAGHKSEVFQAIAHLFVGGLFAAGYVEYRHTYSEFHGRGAMRKIWLGVVLSLIELACAIWFRLTQ